MQTIGISHLATLPPPSGGSATTHRKPPPIYAASNRKILHPMPPEKVEIFKSLESWASNTLLPILKPVEKSWQPAQFLPDPTRPESDFIDEVRALRDRTKGLPDEYFVVLVGDMITEEALPTYQTILNTLDGVRDETGSSPNPWATWIRAWTAEENRHGDLLKSYLYLSGRVDMLMVERTVQCLIGSGMDPKFDKNPYLGFVYTSFQERATFVSHCNTARLASEGGDPLLANICGAIAAYEKRHENAYVKIVEKLLEIDPNEAMIAIGNMMRKKITMPAHLMTDGRDPHLFQHFALLAHKIGVYRPDDYVDILEFLIQRWRLEKLEGLCGDARREQDYVCNLGPRFRKLNGRGDGRLKNYKSQKFSWIFNREVDI